MAASKELTVNNAARAAAGLSSSDDHSKNSGEEKDSFHELKAGETHEIPDGRPCLLLGFRWETTAPNIVCDLDAVAVFFDDNATALALVDCVQDTYNNVAALLGDSVHNSFGGNGQSLETIVIDLNRVDNRVTNIVAGVRSMSMAFKAHAVTNVMCTCSSLSFRRFSNEGHLDLAPAWHQRAVSSRKLYSVQHESLNEQESNLVILLVLSRSNARESWRVSAVCDDVRCSDTTALKHLMSGYVAYPAASAVALKLPSIPALCAALTSKALPAMKDKFLADNNGGNGLARKPFVHTLFMHLYQTNRDLHAKNDAARVVAMLDELFDQIDIDGNGFVDWEEFTSFCIELGIISGKGANDSAFQPDDFGIEYRPVRVPSTSIAGGSNGGGKRVSASGLVAGNRVKPNKRSNCSYVTFMAFVPELKLIYYAEKGSSILKAVDTAGKPHHQYEFPDPLFVEGKRVTVCSVAYVPGRYLAVFCSDHSMNLMKEVKDLRGRTYGYICKEKAVHQLLHKKVIWEPCHQNLISIGSDNHLYSWKVEDMVAGAKRIYLQPEHENTITDIIHIAKNELVATCSLNRRVYVWQMPTWALRTTFCGHTLGVQALSYLNGTLLSASFDWDIIAWNMERLEKIGTMVGHKAPVTAVSQMTCPTNFEDMKAISADSSLEARIWDLSGCVSGGKTIPCLMVFQLSCIKLCARGPKSLCLPFDPKYSMKGYSNMLVAGQTITNLAATKVKNDFFVPPNAEYNASSAHFLTALRRNVHIWDATSGDYIRKLVDVSPRADIVSACFALPFERRLFLGTEDGRLLLVNYVTGNVIDESHPHAAEVAQLVYCKRAKVVISADHHGVVAVSSERQCKLEKLRQVNDVHGARKGITHMTYSQRLSKIITCSGSAEVQVLGFEYLDFVATAIQSADEPATGLAFLDEYSIVLLGDPSRVCLWHLDMDTFKMTCFAKLVVPRQEVLSPDILCNIGVLRREKASDDALVPATPAATTFSPRPRRETEEANCDNGDNTAPTYCEGEVWITLGTESGRLACWTWEDILHASETLPSNPMLQPVPDSLCPSLRANFNPLSRIVKTGGGKSGFYSISGESAAISFDPNDTVDGEDRRSYHIAETAAPRAVWLGHTGPVSRIGSCTQPPCIFTLGEDGFQRIWSTEGTILGQFALPNASDIHVKKSLFRNPIWNFPVDAIRVRSSHEELTVSLLEEINSRRVRQKSSRGSSADEDRCASSVEVTGSTGDATSIVSGRGTADDSMSSRTRAGLKNERRLRSFDSTTSKMTGRPDSDTQERSVAEGDIDNHRRIKFECNGSEGGAVNATDPKETANLVEGEQSAAEGGVTTKGKEMEQRQVTLAAIKRDRGHAVGSFPTREAASASEDNMYPLPSLVTLTTQATCPGRSWKRLPAFSTESLRSGMASGLYDKEEFTTLLTISKNPSMVAAYNRIIDDRRDSFKKANPFPVHAPRVHNRTLGASVSAPALLRPAARPKSLESSITFDSGNESESAKIPSVFTPWPTELTPNKRPHGSSEVRLTSDGSVTFEGNSLVFGKGFTAETNRDATTTQPPPSRVAKMYRNAAREFEKGHSAGLEIWRDLERDESTWSSFRDRGVRRNTRFRGHGSLSSVTPSFADWSSNSSFLELREFEPRTSSDDPASRPQSKEMATSGLEDNGGEYGGRDQEDYEWESEDGEGLLDDTGTSANDRLVPVRGDRDDKLDHSKSASFYRAPRWEDTYAFRRSKSRRGVIRSAPSTDDVYQGSSSSLTSYTPASEKWDWDWSKRPPSCLPAERVDFLLAKINNTTGSDKLSSAPVLSNSVSVPALARTVAGESGGEGCVPESATCSSSISSNGWRREKKGGKRGGVYQASRDLQRRTKHLATLQQKIIALLVKGNDYARRREALDLRRVLKPAKKVSVKGSGPGQLGPHYTLHSVMEFRAAFNFVDENMSGCLDAEEWRRFLNRFNSSVAVVNMRSMFLHLDKDMNGSVEVAELVPVIFNKATAAQHHLIRNLIGYENAKDAKRVSNKMLASTVNTETLQVEDIKELFDLYDSSHSGRLGKNTIRRILLSLKIPQVSWEAFTRYSPQLNRSSPDDRLTAKEFSEGFFEAFVR